MRSYKVSGVQTCALPIWMAAAAVTSLQRSLAEIAGGLVVAPNAAEAPFGTMSMVVGDHPVPGKRSFAAAAQIGRAECRVGGHTLAQGAAAGGRNDLLQSI